MTDTVPRHNPLPTESEIDAAIERHAAAIGRLVRTNSAATLTASSRSDHETYKWFKSRVRMAVARAADEEWRRTEDLAQRAADGAIRRAFAAAVGGAS